MIEKISKFSSENREAPHTIISLCKESKICVSIIAIIKENLAESGSRDFSEKSYLAPVITGIPFAAHYHLSHYTPMLRAMLCTGSDKTHFRNSTSSMTRYNRVKCGMSYILYYHQKACIAYS